MAKRYQQPQTVVSLNPNSVPYAFFFAPSWAGDSDIAGGVALSGVTPGSGVTTFGSFRSFNGSQYLERASDLKGSPLTIIAKIRTAVTAGVQTIGSVGISNAGTKFARLLLYQGAVQAQIQNGTNKRVVGNAYPLNTWFQAAATFSGSVVGSALNGNTPVTSASALALTGEAILGIGKNYNGGTPEYFNGDMEWIAFFPRVLSPAEISEFYRNPYKSFSPIANRIWAPASGGTAYTLTTDSASLTLAGQDANLIAGRRLAADTSALTLAGQDAWLISGRRLVTDSSALTLTAQDTALVAGRRLVADTSALTIAGQDATLTYTPIGGVTYTISADSSAMTLVGQNAALIAGRRLVADIAAFELAVQDAILARGYVMAAASGDFSLDGQDAALIASRRLAAESSDLSISGQDAALTYSGEVAPPVSGAMAGRRIASDSARSARIQTIGRSKNVQTNSRPAR